MTTSIASAPTTSKPQDTVFAAIRAGTFNPADFTLASICAAQYAVTWHCGRGRRIRDIKARKAYMAQVAGLLVPIIKGIAAKWAERGMAALTGKIGDLLEKEDALVDGLAPADSMLLDFLRAERERLKQANELVPA